MKRSAARRASSKASSQAPRSCMISARWTRHRPLWATISGWRSHHPRERVGPLARVAQLVRVPTERDRVAVDDPGDDRRQLAGGGRDEHLVDQPQALGDPSLLDQRASPGRPARARPGRDRRTARRSRRPRRQCRRRPRSRRSPSARARPGSAGSRARRSPPRRLRAGARRARTIRSLARARRGRAGCGRSRTRTGRRGAASPASRWARWARSRPPT